MEECVLHDYGFFNSVQVKLPLMKTSGSRTSITSSQI